MNYSIFRDSPGIPKPVRAFQLVDQIIPPVLSTFLDPGSGDWSVPDGALIETDPTWRPGETLQGGTGSGSFLGRPRKVNPFVAGNDSPLAGNPGLVPVWRGLAGRTAWNTRWLLVIPGRNLGAPGHPDVGIKWFVYGDESNTDGIGVTDIVLLLDAYSYENPF